MNIQLKLESFFTLIFILFLSQCESWETKDHPDDCELVLVQLLYRHGDRNPIDFYPTDPYGNESYWPEGFGQLTKLGKQQHYKLGTYFRNRYDGFLSTEYNPYEIMVKSSDVDRTIMSAQANLAAMFPTDNSSEWDDKIKWQPIPVHTVPKYIDNLLNQKASCPRYEALYDDFMVNSELMKKVNSENAELYEIINSHTGLQIQNVLQVDYFMDSIMIERFHNYTLPEWTKEIFPEYEQKLQELKDLSFKAVTYTQEMKRLKTGPLLAELSENIIGKVNGSLDSRRRFFVYSGHDTTVATVLNTLDIFDNVQPPYCASIMIELHRNITSNTYFVEILYKHGVTHDPVKLEIPGCSFQCSLDKFLEVNKREVPEDWNKACQLKTTVNYNTVGIIVAGMLIFVIIGLCICSGLLIRGYLKKRVIEPKVPAYPYLHLQTEEGDEEA